VGRISDVWTRKPPTSHPIYITGWRQRAASRSSGDTAPTFHNLENWRPAGDRLDQSALPRNYRGEVIKCVR
jgi:hypothetical protein